MTQTVEEILRVGGREGTTEAIGGELVFASYENVFRLFMERAPDNNCNAVLECKPVGTSTFFRVLDIPKDETLQPPMLFSPGDTIRVRAYLLGRQRDDNGTWVRYALQTATV
jgi:hypothetical protein